MKFVTYRRGEEISYGAQMEDGIIPLPEIWPDVPDSLQALIAADGLAKAKSRCESSSARLGLDEVTLLSPLQAPGKLIGLAVNYVAHHKEFDRGELPDKPFITPRPFIMPDTALADPLSVIPWPDFSEEIDYELELAVVIGRTAKDIGPDQARDAIAGYTIANDVSARSTTHAVGRKTRPKDDFFDWLHGKWADGFLPLGPCFVPAADIGDPQNLDLQTTVNGEVRQDSNTSLMIFDVFELVAFCSRLMTLQPGDIIATGTPSGVGKATGKLLQPGDRIRCSIEKIGTLENTMGPKPETWYTPCEK
ncbi:MAG: fumarylacetoacetate hydrolase family protein [Phycisphaerae bacterium]